MENISEYIKVLLKVFTVFVTFMSTVISSLVGGGGGTTTTTAPSGTTTTSQVSTTGTNTSDDDAFVLTAYGYGHGVGMSQEGAITMAKSGSTYVQILTHYYKGTAVIQEATTPTQITYGSTKMGLVEFLCKTTKQEIGDSAPEAAVKAQAAAIYTFAKYYSYTVKTSQIAIDADYDYVNTKVYEYVLSYLGMANATSAPVGKFVSTDGKKAALTVFCASVAGKTTDAKNVWGGSGYAYLVPVTSPEEISRKTVSISSKNMKDYIYDYNVNINLGSDPSGWIVIDSHDSAVSSKIGYVSYVYIGDKKITGYQFRCNVLDFAIRSHCFTVNYEPAS